MNHYEFYKSILRHISRFKLRSLFMAAGITFSVFTLSVGMLASREVTAQFDAYFNKTFLPNSINLTTSASALEQQPLRPEEVDAVVNTVAGIALWTPVIIGPRQPVVYQANSATPIIFGLDITAEQLMGHRVAVGRYFDENAVLSRARVMVLGATAARKLLGDRDNIAAFVAAGGSVRYGNSLYSVVGVLQERGSNPHGGDMDEIVVIPYTTAQVLNRATDLYTVRMMAERGADVEAVAAAVRDVLRRQRNMTEGQVETFAVLTAPEGRMQLNQFLSTYDKILYAITGLTFAVSAVVIGMVMLTGIKERIAEIGLRQAVGATKSDLKFQFIVESASTAAVGALLGVLLLQIALPGLSSFISSRMGGEFHLPADDIAVMALAVACAILVGLLSGYYPAQKAARIQPASALRS